MALEFANQSLQTLYRALLQQARKLPQYNFRMHALRRIKEDFAAAQNLAKDEEIAKFEQDEQAALQQLKRIVKVQSLYSSDSSTLVIEHNKTEEKQ